ncbi:MAG: MqnA/MqnD/SBP family protein [Candidatus Auribacterota bacterium]
MILKIGHTPDTDDAFMYYALLHNKINLQSLQFEDSLEPISNLNSKANSGFYDISAFSAGYIPHISDKYDLLTAGACMADNHGPLLIKRKNASGNRIAVPGLNTTAYAVMRLYDPDADCVEVPFDRILEYVINGTVDGGILISEDQMKIPANHLTATDLGDWWKTETGYPLPLGVDAIRSALPENTKQLFCTIFRRSIEYALNYPEEALKYAIQFGRGISAKSAEVFVKRFVNPYTVNLGETGRQAIAVFLERLYEARLCPSRIKMTFIEGE